MRTNAKESLWGSIEQLIQIVSIALLASIFIIVGIAIFDHNSTGEASIGSFDVTELNNGWVVEKNGTPEKISLPGFVECESGDCIKITNTLPNNLVDGMHLMMRASMEDLEIYIDGKLRESYTNERVKTTYYSPSAYVVASLNEEDAGKEIKIFLEVKDQGFVNSVTIGHGNNVWFPILQKSLMVNFVALLVLILGIILLVVIMFMSRTFKDSKASKYLGLLMIDVALWVISESTMRQFIFARPSLTQYFSIMTMELMGAFACMYFDEVQHKHFHKRYMLVEGGILVQMLINVVLHMVGVMDMYKTMLFSHFWMVVAMVVFVACVVQDFLLKRIKSYRVTATGMVCFVFVSVIELVAFYVTRFFVLGTFVCIGLIMLMTSTIIQALYDEVASADAREKRQIQMINNTIETIASAIDARDEYTGGHSERVGLYAERLAREMAADYDFSEEDILRIRYIGLIHDIGKIGVADSVLNKAGRLTDEEYALMKKHTDIGYEIMGVTGESIEGLLDGIKYHHERFDGKGYPEGLSYTDIPLVARILSLADCYDAMTSNRVYRKRLSDEEVRNELVRCAGTQFDPALTDIFLRLIDRGEMEANTSHGMATNQNGSVQMSSKLENRMQSDLHNHVNVLNPSHVRMLCYIIKLMENQKRSSHILFYGPGKSVDNSPEELAKKWDVLHAVIKENMGRFDAMIHYAENLCVFAVFDRSEEEIIALMRSIEVACEDVFVENMR